ncbi:hypothetical protein RAC89_12190 [Paenibacillus sp. GD4]|uniref:hypothetical protein n=1 Tax=Paenibacillus TaxID=44249 RepID=UPI0025438B24|nr:MULTISPECIES: hypothetical protein [Paenibacillus]MDQ1911206.1 hypothetical protein [Paenibacillus sp. GD4]
MPLNSRYYVVYDEFTISICTLLEEVFEALAGGSNLYGYTDDEQLAQLLMTECFHILEKK